MDLRDSVSGDLLRDRSGDHAVPAGRLPVVHRRCRCSRWRHGPGSARRAVDAGSDTGDSTNYVIGRTAGEKLFSNPRSKIFRRDYLLRTQAFYERHGGKTVTLARFLPIIRTFAPFVAGVGRMHYPRFVGFSMLGSVLWVGSLVTLGFFFGNVPFIKQNLTFLVLAIIVLSLLPMIIGVVRSRTGRSVDVS